MAKKSETAKTAAKANTKTSPVEVPTSEVPDWSVVSGLRKTKFEEVIERAVVVNDAISELKKELDDLKADGLDLLLRAGVKSVRFYGRQITRKDGTSSHLDRVKLLELGVKESVILKATEVSTYTTLLIGKEKEEGGGQ